MPFGLDSRPSRSIELPVAAHGFCLSLEGARGSSDVEDGDRADRGSSLVTDEQGEPLERASSGLSRSALSNRWGVAAICIGVGQGLAVLLENVS